MARSQGRCGGSRSRGRLSACAVLVALVVGLGGVRAESPPSESEQFEARIREVANSLRDHPRLKKLSQQERERVVEFITGNVLFVVLHEMAHAAVSELDLDVLGREEDAADDFAALQLLKVGSALSHRVLVEAAKGWFFSDRRDRRDGEKLVFYDEHSLDQVRAYNIVCLIVGSSPGKFTDLANEVKLPADRQATCPKDFARVARSWDRVMKPHRRNGEQPKTRIEVVYEDVRGELSPYAQGFRGIRLLEAIAEHAADQLVWPSPFTLEMQSCGDINASWKSSDHKLTVCYELAADFGELYRDFVVRAAYAKRRKLK
jgi:putative metallopeptidase DUF4344